MRTVVVIEYTYITYGFNGELPRHVYMVGQVRHRLVIAPSPIQWPTCVAGMAKSRTRYLKLFSY